MKSSVNMSALLEYMKKDANYRCGSLFKQLMSVT